MSLSIRCLLSLLQAVGGLLKYLDDDLLVLNTSVVKSVFNRCTTIAMPLTLACLLEDTRPKSSRLSYYGCIMLSAKAAYAIKSFNLSSFPSIKKLLCFFLEEEMLSLFITLTESRTWIWL